MSNQVNLIRTEFKSVLGTSFGYRAYDDYDQSYDNSFDATLPEDPQEFLNIVIESADTKTNEMIEFAQENEKGMYIDGDYITFEDLKPMLEKAFALLEGKQ